MQREAVAGARGVQRLLELLAEMKAVGDLGQRVVAGEPCDALLGALLFGDVLLQVHPTAALERLVADHVAELARGKTFSYVQEMKDGRTIRPCARSSSPSSKPPASSSK